MQIQVILILSLYTNKQTNTGKDVKSKEVLYTVEISLAVTENSMDTS